jgi:hypothetical protein
MWSCASVSQYIQLLIRKGPKLPSTTMLFNVMRKENLRILYLQDVLGIVLIFEAEYIVTCKGLRVTSIADSSLEDRI